MVGKAASILLSGNPFVTFLGVFLVSWLHWIYFTRDDRDSVLFACGNGIYLYCISLILPLVGWKFPYAGIQVQLLTPGSACTYQ